MPILIETPARMRAAGTREKLIDEYVGRVNSATAAVSIAHMRSPAGWEEPGQRPKFDEYTLVLRGGLRVDTRVGYWRWRAEYIAVCLPAFSLEAVHRDE